MSLEDKTNHEHTNGASKVTRRNFLSLVGWGSIFSAVGLFLIGMVRSMRPNVLYEPPTKFKAGRPEDYPEGAPTFIAEESVFIDRDEKGIYAMSAKCTHLGCNVLWMASENGFHCPCHGAKFDRAGINTAGPAPSPLLRLEISKDKDGRLVVDKGVAMSREFRLVV